MNVLKLKAKMVEAGYSQRDLATAMKQSKNTINRKINGNIPMNTDDILAFCELLHIDLDTDIVDIFLRTPS